MRSFSVLLAMASAAAVLTLACVGCTQEPGGRGAVSTSALPADATSSSASGSMPTC